MEVENNCLLRCFLLPIEVYVGGDKRVLLWAIVDQEVQIHGQISVQDVVVKEHVFLFLSKLLYEENVVEMKI